MNSIELFAGIGGISLAAEWAGIETKAFCEINPFSQKVLQKNWPDVPIFDDIKKLNKQTLEAGGVDVGAIELISGGFPCQPYSGAGKREGKDDDRDLWPEMFRLIEEIRPRWVVGENVANFISMELDRTLFNLESLGYTGKSFLIPACSVNAPHKRDRVFVVGHSNSKSELQENQTVSTIRSKRDARKSASGEFGGTLPRSYWEEHQPPVCGMDDGISGGLDKDRLIALGNAVVPQQIYPIFKYIMEIERRSIC